MQPTVKILGARGSVPVSGNEFHRYGGATCCIFLRLAGQPIVLDAGTGILHLPEMLKDGEKNIPLLLSHPHADHLLGLPMCTPAADADMHFHIYAEAHGGLEPEAQLRALMKPPLWPIGPELLPARLDYHTITGPFALGGVTVDIISGEHPGGVTLFRLSGGGKTVVYMTDCTLKGEALAAAEDFAKGCDLLLCDGQYSAEEWPRYDGFGHSSWDAAAKLGADCGAARTMIIHHAPTRSDNELDAAAAALSKLYPRCGFAHEGEEIQL